MSSVPVKSLSNGLNIQLLEEDQAARSVVVSNIAPQTTKERVIIHFQRQRNGGGEINNIHIPKKGTAVITFDSSQVVETVLKRSHTLEGSTLEIDRLMPGDHPEVFRRVTARVNFDRFQLSPQQSQNALQALKDKTEVKYSGVSNMECVLSGTFNQIESAQKLLQGVFQRRSSVPQQSTGVNETFHYGDTTQTQQNSSDTWDTDHGAIDNFDTKDLSSFEVQPQFMKFLKRVYNKELKDIEETHGVEIVWSENAPQVQISPGRALKTLRSYQKGCDAFIDLYQKCFPNIGREVVELKSADNTGGLIIEAISSVEAENKVIIEMTDNKLLVYAEKSEINGSVQALKEKLGLSQGSNRKTRRSQRSKTREHENPQEGRLSTLKKLLANAVEFSLHQSDITDERVDAIVNAANDGLQHGGGVAAAIVRKGGHQIEEESRRIMSGRKWRPLNVGDAVYTRGGNLSCRFVIHAVGPRWNARERSRCISLLSRACIESLRLAANLELCSIAVPAISSGIFGMPKDTCAQVMFDAVEEFSSSTDAEFSTLRDVRIVIIDDETISFFREEFIRRYTSQETSQTNVTHQERPSSGEQEGSFASNATVEPPSFSPAVEPPEKLSKKSGKDYENSDTSNEGLGPAGESSSNPEEVLNGTKEVHPSNENIPNASKACPPTGIETSDVETEANGTMKQPGLKASAPVKSSEQSNVNITARPSSGRGGGRGRGVLAANFTGRGHSEPGFKSSGSTQLYKTGEANSPNAGRGRGITYATSRYSPPGLTVTDEGISLAQNLGKGVKGDHNTSALSMNDKKEAEINEPTNEALKDENQESKQNSQKIDGDKLNAECPRGHTEVKNKSSHSKLDQEDVPGTRLSPDDKITDSQETQKELREESATDGGSKLPTNENRPNEPENETAEPSIQVDQSSSGATNDETTYPKEPLPSNQSGTSQAIHSKLDQGDVPGTRLSPDGKITDSQETQKELCEESATDGGSKLPTNENRPNEPENETAEPSIQVDQSSSGATSDETVYPEEPLPSNQSGTSQATKEVTPTASHGSVNEHDTVEERRTAENSTAHSGKAPPRETLRIHQTSEPKCGMCMNLNKDPVFPLQCGHYFCKSCLKSFIEKMKVCPKCKPENQFRGNQPLGYMTWRAESHSSLPGYEECGTIVITYNFPQGIQGSQHPNPGQPYCGLFCTSYLPNSSAGQELCNLLRKAFDARLIFTIGKSPATGEENNIVLNGIELKTNRHGGPANYGYPDPSYLDRALSQLAKKGITQLQDEPLQ